MKHSYCKCTRSRGREDVRGCDSLSWCWGSATDLFRQDPWNAERYEDKGEVLLFVMYVDSRDYCKSRVHQLTCRNDLETCLFCFLGTLLRDFFIGVTVSHRTSIETLKQKTTCCFFSATFTLWGWKFIDCFCAATLTWITPSWRIIISNLPFVERNSMKEKVSELHVSAPQNNSTFAKFLFGIGKYHSTETVLSKVTSDLPVASEQACALYLAPLDSSAALDTIDHSTFYKLWYLVGVWLSFIMIFTLSLKQAAPINNYYVSLSTLIKHGVARGSFVAAVWFYIRPPCHSIHGYWISFRIFTDDTLLYFPLRPSDFEVQSSCRTS